MISGLACSNYNGLLLSSLKYFNAWFHHTLCAIKIKTYFSNENDPVNCHCLVLMVLLPWDYMRFQPLSEGRYEAYSDMLRYRYTAILIFFIKHL